APLRCALCSLARFAPFGALPPAAVELVVDREIMLRWRALAERAAPAELMVHARAWENGGHERIRSTGNAFDTTIADSVISLNASLRQAALENHRLLAVGEGCSSIRDCVDDEGRGTRHEGKA